MAEQNDTAPTDAFKDIMAAARAEPGRLELAHQSLGRPLAETELALADALMGIYAQGETDPTAVAAALCERGVVAPSSGKCQWTAQSLEAELQALNKELDAAYSQNGFTAMNAEN